MPYAYMLGRTLLPHCLSSLPPPPPPPRTLSLASDT